MSQCHFRWYGWKPVPVRVRVLILGRKMPSPMPSQHAITIPGDIPAVPHSLAAQRVRKAAQAHPAHTPCSHHILLSPSFLLHLGTCLDGYQATRKYHTFLLPLSNWHIPRPTTHALESPCRCCDKCPWGLGAVTTCLSRSTEFIKQSPRTQQLSDKLISGCHTDQIQLRELTCR